MFDQAINNFRQATEETIRFQQDLFNKWVGLWAPPASPEAFSPLALQKKWVEILGEVIKKHRETVEAQFGAGLRNIEEAFRLAEAKDPRELRARTIELWQKAFDGQRQLYETQLRDVQAAVAKWAEPATKGAA